MSPASSDASMLAVAVPAPLHPTLLVVDSCTREHANFLVLGQIVSGLVVSPVPLLCYHLGNPVFAGAQGTRQRH
jgi:hypothetical protein